MNQNSLASDYTYGADSERLSVLTDEELLSRVARRDESSFELLYARFGPAIYRYLIHLLGDEGVAEDVLQEVFLAVWNGAGRFRRQARVKTWILRIAHHQAVSWWRSSQGKYASQATLREEVPFDGDRDGKDLEGVLFEGWERESVVGALKMLSAEHREVIELAFYHGLSYTEIAMVVNCPVGTVKSRMSYARRHLFGLLRRMEKGSESEQVLR